ncbi:MAG TPA: DUF3489 domain-containing protein [Bryobacteraceae bacterium]|nr:DUF3489 domain-containing protein [Bryobacteraceae bacterium]
MILTISKDNHITVLDSIAEAERQPETEHFTSAKELAKLASNWPTARLVEIWNHLPGATPVKKFTDRNTGVNRIWKALQELTPPTEAADQDIPNEPPAPGEPVVKELALEESELPAEAAQHDAPLTPQTRDVATPEASPTEEPTSKKRARNAAPREGTKATIIVGLLKRDGGVSLQELMDATGWQKHSVRGFLAGTVGKKMKLALTSTKKEDGTRMYSIAAS